MTAFAIILLFGLFVTTCRANMPLVFSMDCERTPIPSERNFDECVFIDMFGQDKFGGLSSRSGNQAMEGSLFDEEGQEIEASHISVTRHDDDQDPITKNAFVIIVDPVFDNVFQLECDLATGVSEEHVITYEDGEVFGEAVLPPEAAEENMKHLISPEEEVDRQRGNLPAQGFRLRLQILYDPAFARNFGGDQSRIRRAIDKILVHANSYYKSPSLTTQIELDTSGRPYKAIGTTFFATGGNLGKFSFDSGILNGVPDADSYALLSYEGNKRGTIGIAYVGATCGPRTARTSINEYTRDEMKTAATLVHEIGHNLGMRHDFDPPRYLNTKKKRYSKQGQLCSGIGGFMDYYGVTTKWSRCSVEDFTDYYNRVRNWCLRDLEPGSGSPTVKPPVRPTGKPPVCKDNSIFCFKFLCGIRKSKCRKTCGLC